MRGTLVRKAAGMVALGGGVLLSLASNDPAGGDRTDGECPAGEICSPDTPNGLYFGGANLGDDVFAPVVAPQRTAVGGRQTIHVFRDADAAQEFVGFTALSSGAAFTVVASSGNTVGIEGAATGDAYLRLVDPANDELYDRISLGVAEPDDFLIVPNRLGTAGDKELFEAKKPLVVYHATYSLQAFAFAIYDVGETRLVDESVAFTLPPSPEKDTRTWARTPPAAGRQPRRGRPRDRLHPRQR